MQSGYEKEDLNAGLNVVRHLYNETESEFAPTPSLSNEEQAELDAFTELVAKIDGRPAESKSFGGPSSDSLDNIFAAAAEAIPPVGQSNTPASNRPALRLVKLKSIWQKTSRYAIAATVLITVGLLSVNLLNQQVGASNSDQSESAMAENNAAERDDLRQSPPAEAIIAADVSAEEEESPVNGYASSRNAELFTPPPSAPVAVSQPSAQSRQRMGAGLQQVGSQQTSALSWDDDPSDLQVVRWRLESMDELEDDLAWDDTIQPLEALRPDSTSRPRNSNN